MISSPAFAHRLEVRFRDCDGMRHVNNAVYLTYLEQTRFALWRQVSGEVPGPGSGIIIARNEIDYRAPAVAGDLIEIRLGVDAIGRSSFTLAYDIVRVGDGVLLAEAKTVVVTYDYAGGKSRPIPAAWRAHLEAAKEGKLVAREDGT